MAKKYKHIEDYYSDYPNNGAVFFTLPDGTRSPLFSSKEKATAWYNNWIRNNPDTHISVGGTSTTTKRTKGSGTKTTVAKPAETQEQRDARFLKKYGKTEAEATELQQQLILAGYLPEGADDGHWGDKSKAAWDAYINDEAAYWDGVEDNVEGTGVAYTEEQKEQAADNYMDLLTNYYKPDFDKYTTPEGGFNSGVYGSGKSKPWIDLSGTWAGDALNWTKKFINDAIFLNKNGIRTANMNTGAYEKYWKDGFDALGYLIGAGTLAEAGVFNNLYRFGKPWLHALTKATPGNLVRNVGYYVPKAQAFLNQVAPWADAAWYSYWGGTGLDQMYQGITAEGGPNWEQISDGTIRTAMGVPYGLFPEYLVGTSLTPAFTTTANAVLNTSNAANRAEAVGNALWLGGIGASAKQPSLPVNENTEFTDNRSSVNTERLWELSTIFPAFKASVRGTRALFSPNSRWYSPYYRSYEPTKKAAELQKQFDAATKTSKGIYSPTEAKNFLKRFKVNNINTINYDDAFNAFLRTLGVNPADRYQKFKTITGNTIRTFDWAYPASFWGWRIGSDFTTGGYLVNQGSSLTGDTIITTSEEDPYTVNIPVDPVDSSKVEEEDSDETSTGNTPL